MILNVKSSKDSIWCSQCFHTNRSCRAVSVVVVSSSESLSSSSQPPKFDLLLNSIGTEILLSRPRPAIVRVPSWSVILEAFSQSLRMSLAIVFSSSRSFSIAGFRVWHISTAAPGLSI